MSYGCKERDGVFVLLQHVISQSIPRELAVQSPLCNDVIVLCIFYGIPLLNSISATLSSLSSVLPRSPLVCCSVSRTSKIHQQGEKQLRLSSFCTRYTFLSFFGYDDLWSQVTPEFTFTDPHRESLRCLESILLSLSQYTIHQSLNYEHNSINSEFELTLLTIEKELPNALLSFLCLNFQSLIPVFRFNTFDESLFVL